MSEAAPLTFASCLLVCARTPELVAQFDRLTGHHLSQIGGRSPLSAMIDEATGRDREAIEAFIEFVWDVVWTRLPRGIQAAPADRRET